MRNLCHSLLNMTVVSLRQKAVHSSRHHSPNDFFAHRMRNKITAITSASALLDGVHNDTNDSEIPDLARIILTGATDLERDLSRWVSLIDYGFGKKQRTTIQEELDRAIRSTRFCTGHTHTIEVVTADTPITVVDAHKQSLMYMFEAALLSHLEPAKIASSTSIQCSRVYTPSQFTVCLQTGMTIEGKQTGPVLEVPL